MAEIKLNKPLYEEKSPTPSGGESGATGAGRPPRGPRPNALARIGAGIIDLLVLHFAGLMIIRFASEPVIALGGAAAWVGLAVGWLYFALGASEFTGGRTVGKAILQLRTVDVTGPDLSFGKAGWRSALIVWPLALFLVTDRTAEGLDRPDVLTLAPLYGRLAGAVVFGWWLGNVFFSALDAYGRTVWDHWSGAIVITSDCEAEALGPFMRSARDETAAGGLPRRPLGALVFTLLICVGFFVWLIWRETQRLGQLSPEERTHFLEQKKRLFVEGFGQPIPLGPSREAAEADNQTSTVHFQYRRRGPVDATALKKDPAIMNKAKELAEVTLAEMKRHLEREKETVPLDIFPAKVRFDVGFASYCDLLFAWDAVEVLTLSHTVPLRAELQAAMRGQRRAMSRSEQETTSPAHSARKETETDSGTTSTVEEPAEIAGTSAKEAVTSLAE
ncbi:MAG: RDD family protein [Candidatus Sumerlaeaceae bacterium]|nr:RDD family protein [Candidatus Sumerlaeaceae bacterium]